MSAKKRKLKVYYGHHSNSYKQHPVIRLAGHYLTKFDFKIGDMVEIIGENQKITITKLS